MSHLTHLTLCTGIGGIDLAAEWAGFTTIGQCEIDGYASRVLEKNFKGIKNYGDIKSITADRLFTEDGIRPGEITVISAGFPCQPYSLAGKGKGDGDERDLWTEVARVVGELKPRWFVGENVPGLLTRGNSRYFRRILAGLAALGYTVTWGVWGAYEIGARHKRDRVFLVAYASSKRRRIMDKNKESGCPNVDLQNINDAFAQGSQPLTEDILRFFVERQFTKPSCGVLRNDNGLSKGVDRLRCLGNAVVPHQIYPIFKAIAEIENSITKCI